MGWWWPAAGLGELSTAVRARDLLKEATIIFINSTIRCTSWVAPHSMVRSFIELDKAVVYVITVISFL